MTDATMWIMGHADNLLMLAGSMLLGWVGVATWKGRLLSRIMLVAGAAFWKVEQRLVREMKAASADGKLTASEAKLAFTAALDEARALLSLSWLGKLLAAIVGVDADKWIEARLEGLAATQNKAGASPLGLALPPPPSSQR